jgi:oligopeptide/dipeptide ABC transporter ATP-binding protein
MNVLEVENLRTYFFTRRGVVKAVDGVSFSLGEGESLGLVGESGCGKSITALSILKLVPEPAGKIVDGKIRLRGEDILPKTAKEMTLIRGKKISMILQDPMSSLNPVFTVGNQVAESFRIHQGIKGSLLRRKVMDILRQLRIPSPETGIHSYPHQMSGGMRQRVVGAIAISCQPDVLIADEPTTSLDVTIQAQYLTLLKDIQAQSKMALIFISHDLGVVALMCSRIAVMYAGRIVEAAMTEDIFDRPAHPYTAGLIKSLPKLGTKSERLASIEGQPPSLQNLGSGCRFAPRCKKATEICFSQYPAATQLSDSHYVHCWWPEGS